MLDSTRGSGFSLDGWMGIFTLFYLVMDDWQVIFQLSTYCTTSSSLAQTMQELLPFYLRV